MHSRLITVICSALLLTACEQAINQGAALYIKSEIMKACGAQDQACIAAVDELFFPCHDQHKQHWTAYMRAEPGEEDSHLDQYYLGLYGCIVDQDGQAYFEYAPAQ
jgi:hypothetical protein